MEPSAWDADLENKWQGLRARLDEVSHLLETQGVLEPKMHRGKKLWRVRFMQTVEGTPKRRTIHVGAHPELLRRVRQLLDHYRELRQWNNETVALAKLILYGGVNFSKGILRSCKRPRAS